jgi:uncharacterized protein (DUF1800 family)
MTISVPRWSKTFLRLLSFAFIAVFCGAINTSLAASPKAPTLLSQSDSSTRAIALESATFKGEPFPLTASVPFGTDTRTRVCIFAMNVELLVGEGRSAFSADAEDASHVRYPLIVEYVGQVPDFEGVTMIVVRLNDAMSDIGDVLLRLNLHGMASNRVRMAVGHVGGGLSDDLGAVPTPAPQAPPAATTSLTIEQYRSQFSDPTFSGDQDLRRFLEQASWGGKGDDSDFQHLRSVGIQSYITEQFNSPALFGNSNYPVTPLYPINQPSPCDATCVRDNYTLYPLQKQLMTNVLTRSDQLRQRVAFALHKLIVVGGAQLNNNETSWYAPYLQALDRNAFGNFRTLLYEITLNPGMGEYLNMRGNSVVNRANPTPNENYSREIMQLFSIGVDTVNQDGTPVLDAQGNRIPSYDQADIANLARVFTGWDLDANKTWSVDGVTSVTNYLDPMVPNGNINRYDIGLKTLLTDINHATPVVVPACTNCTGGTAAQNLANTKTYAINELNTAIDNLFNHSNTGPYICGQLIRQLVTSNPSPPYVGRCSAAFANNGSGVRGDMKAVITAILLDPESRGDLKNDPSYGHLREPLLLMTHLLRAFNASGDGVLVTSSPNSYSNDMGQNLFNPPTVFSYFPSDYGLPGTTLFGPEFGLLDTSTTYKRANFMNTLFLANSGNGIPVNGTNRPTGTTIDYSAYQSLAASPQALVDALFVKLMHDNPAGQPSYWPQIKANIVSAVTAVTNANATTQARQRTQTAIYLIATSAHYQVER